MSDENVSDVVEDAEKASAGGGASEKINAYKGKVDEIVERLLGIVGDHPWEKWLGAANENVVKFMPAAIALAALVGCVGGLIVTIRYDMPFSIVIANLWILVLGAFSMHLAPKAMALPRSFVEKNELEMVRPELLYIGKVVLGLGGLVLAVFLTLKFDGEMFGLAIAVALYALMAIVVFSRPEIMGVKAGYPTNCVEEAITLVLMPIRVVLALMAILVGLCTIGGLVYGIIQLFRNGMEAIIYLDITTVVPLVAPLAIYFAYLNIMFILDLYRALVSIPRKLDALRKD